MITGIVSRLSHCGRESCRLSQKVHSADVSRTVVYVTMCYLTIHRSLLQHYKMDRYTHLQERSTHPATHKGHKSSSGNKDKRRRLVSYPGIMF